MFHHCIEHYEVGEVIPSGRWGRVIRGHSGKHGHFARETLWEHIRATEFADRPSRWSCAYAYEDLGTAQTRRVAETQGNGGWWLSLYRVEPVEDGAVHVADLAYLEDMQLLTDPAQLVERVRAYWRGDRVSEAAEVLVPSGLRVIEVLAGPADIVP